MNVEGVTPMRITGKGIVWIMLLMLLAISLSGCGTKGRASKGGVTVEREVFKW